jgi:ribosomal protein L31E
MNDKQYPRHSKKVASSWHPAFVEAIQADLAAYREYLEFTPELQLTSESLRIDFAIVKKAEGIIIDNPIARIFRKNNILEYKSPSDYLSIGDFAQVHAYAYQYAAITPDVDLADITLTFVENRHPRKFLHYLKHEFELKIENPSPGIYLVQRKHLPLQVVETKLLPEKENVFLKSLTNTLSGDMIEVILDARERIGQAVRLKAYFDIVIKENPEAFLEVQNMARKSLTIDDVLIQTGLAQRFEERGREQTARNLLNRHMSIEEIASITELPIEKVRALAATWRDALGTPARKRTE